MKNLVARGMLMAVLICVFMLHSVFAGTEGSISGTVTDPDGIALSGAKVRILSEGEKERKSALTGTSGNFEVFPLDFGDYSVVVEAPGFPPYRAPVHVSSGGVSQVQIQLEKGKEITLKVEAKRNRVSDHSATSSRQVSQDDIQKLPQGDDIKLPKLLATTNPGIVQGPFGQTFVRGNHANIQYQIDGVQLPDSPSNTFGQAFSPRNIDHMEVVTGGIPAEYGERLAAVVNIISKTGAETPGGNAEINYGSNNIFSPQGSFSGSNGEGNLHYYLSAGYSRTDRGLDTPQPKTSGDVTAGGKDAVHDESHGNDEFLKLDWLPGNEDKVSLIGFNAFSFYEIPNFPAGFNPTDPLFTSSDQFGNPALAYRPSGTGDTQSERNTYVEAVWKHSFDSRSFLQIAPYYKYSSVKVGNDPINDLYAAVNSISDSSSFTEDRHVHNFGLKADYTERAGERNLFKAGVQGRSSKAIGPIQVISQPSGGTATSSADLSSTTGYFESVYLQDDFTISKQWTLNAGVRFDATQFKFSGLSVNDQALQPRIGLNYLVSEATKLHVFYGRLFQPAPSENLRDTFVTVGGGNKLFPYDIKAEKDDYYEIGVAQQWGSQVVNFNLYYKNAKNMLDDAQLLNTSIAQPYNFARGYAYGAEVSVQGKISENWSDYANYSYEIAKGRGISGGLFTLPAGTVLGTGYQFLDHVQIHTANAGATYAVGRYLWSTQGLFGSGLRTGNGNSKSLPAHFTVDTSLGYDFSSESWLSKFKLSFDVLNFFDHVYPITLSNGFNGSHYAAGREYFVRLAKSF